jgi:hypothetical protein
MIRSVAILGMVFAWASAATARPSTPTNAGKLSVEAGNPGVAARLGAAFGSITSIHRSPAHNRAVGGVPNSYHLQGRAIDIARRPGVSHAQVAAALRTAGYKLIESLDEGDHSHFAFGPINDPRGLRANRGVAVAPKTEPASVQAAVAPPPPVKRLAADYHGTLLLDLQTSRQTRLPQDVPAGVQARR